MANSISHPLPLNKYEGKPGSANGWEESPATQTEQSFSQLTPLDRSLSQPTPLEIKSSEPTPIDQYRTNNQPQITVTSHPVGGIGPDHLALQYDDGNGNITTISAGPDWNPSNGSIPGQLENTPGRETDQNNDFVANVIPPDGMTTESYWGILQQAGNNYDNGLDYDLLPEVLFPDDTGYNSNSYVFGMLEATGGQAEGVNPGDYQGGLTPVPASEFQPDAQPTDANINPNFEISPDVNLPGGGTLTYSVPNTISVSLPGGGSLPYGSNGYTLAPPSSYPSSTPSTMPSGTIPVSMPGGGSLPYGSNGYTLAPGY